MVEPNVEHPGLRRAAFLIFLEYWTEEHEAANIGLVIMWVVGRWTHGLIDCFDHWQGNKFITPCILHMFITDK